MAIRQIEQNANTFAKELRSAFDLIKDRDRTIAILEENLDRARVDHLEQLRAVEQMLIVLKSNNLGDVGAYTVGAMKMAIAVIRNNIEKLDPV
jgi:hypothetical protein